MNELEEIKEEEEELMCQISRLSLKLERLKVRLNEVKKKKLRLIMNHGQKSLLEYTND
ncbi:MAG: hypothetical protein N2V78_09530 [Methanophagales archaeon]|nr:hypothetical protein [Methanophagales archaeon]